MISNLATYAKMPTLTPARDREPQGWAGQKPQEENCREPKRPTPAPRQTPEKGVSAAVAPIRARFGYCAIGLGYCGIRYSAREPS
jgi:hypothetical protein